MTVTQFVVTTHSRENWAMRGGAKRAAEVEAIYSCFAFNHFIEKVFQIYS